MTFKKTLIVTLVVLAALCLIVFGLTIAFVSTSYGQEARTPKQIAENCKVSEGKVLVQDMADEAEIHLPDGKAVFNYELAFTDGGKHSAICIQTCPFEQGYVERVIKLMFGDGSRRFTIYEHRVVKTVK